MSPATSAPEMCGIGIFTRSRPRRCQRSRWFSAHARTRTTTQPGSRDRIRRVLVSQDLGAAMLVKTDRAHLPRSSRNAMSLRELRTFELRTSNFELRTLRNSELRLDDLDRAELAQRVGVPGIADRPRPQLLGVQVPLRRGARSSGTSRSTRGTNRSNVSSGSA